MTTQFRVYKLPVALKKLCAEYRTKNGQTWEMLLDEVEKGVPELVSQVLGLGISPCHDAKPARLPMSPELLASLSAGSAACGLPGTVLFQASLLRLVGGGALLPSAKTGTRGKGKEGPRTGKKRAGTKLAATRGTKSK